MKIVFLVPAGTFHAMRWRGERIMPSVGVGYVVSALAHAGYEVHLLDASRKGLSAREQWEMLRRLGPDVICMSVTTQNRFVVFDAARTARRLLPGVKVVLGGIHASMCAEDILRNVPEVDVVVRGEGEPVVVDLVGCLGKGCPPSGVPGVCFRSEGEVRCTAAGGVVEDLDGLHRPFAGLPAADVLFLMDFPLEGRTLPAYPLCASRGCPFGCYFCSSSRFWGKKVRSRSVESVLGEMEYARDVLGARAVWFVDDTFTLDARRLTALCEEMIGRNVGMPWFCEARLDTLDSELLRMMYRAGCRRIGIGVESASARIQEALLGKVVSPSEVYSVAEECARLGILLHLFFIVGHPGESYVEARRTLRMALSLRRRHDPSLGVMHVYPGTEMERIAREEGVLPPGFSWSRREDMEKVPSLEGIHGDVPLYFGHMTRGEMIRLLGRWAIGRYGGWRALLGGARMIGRRGNPTWRLGGFLGWIPRVGRERG